MQRHLVFLSACLFCVTACLPQDMALSPVLRDLSSPVSRPSGVETPERSILELNQDHTLQSWWTFFNDEQLNLIISSSLNLKRGNAPDGVDSKDFNALVAYYAPPEVDVIHEVISAYFEYRFLQNKHELMQQILQAYRDGAHLSASQDRDEISALSTEAEAAKMQMSSLIETLSNRSSLLQEYLDETLAQRIALPQANITPFFASEADLLKNSPYVIAGRVELLQHKAKGLNLSDIDFTFVEDQMNALFGINDEVYSNQGAYWSVSAGDAILGVDFSTLKTRCHCPEGMKVFEGRILSYTMDLERLLVSYSHIQKQYDVLKDASERAEENVSLLERSEDDAFDVHYTSYKSQIAALRAEHEALKTLLSLYKILGVY